MNIERRKALYAVYESAKPLDAAELLLDAVAEDELAYPFVTLLLGQAHFASAKFEEAVRYFHRAFDAAPTPETLLNITAAHAALGQAQEIAALINAHPQFTAPDARLNLAVAHLGAGDVLSASEALAAAGASDEDTAAAVERAVAYASDAFVPADSGAAEGATDGPEYYLLHPRLTKASALDPDFTLPAVRGRAGTDAPLTPAQQTAVAHNERVLSLRHGRVAGGAAFVRQNWAQFVERAASGLDAITAKPGQAWRKIPLLLKKEKRLPRIHKSKAARQPGYDGRDTSAKWQKVLTRKQRRRMHQKGTGGHQGA